MPRKRPGRAGARFALVLRLLGATGFFVALLGLIPLATAIDLTSQNDWDTAIRQFCEELPRPTFSHGDRDIGIAMILGGGAVFLLTAVILMLTGLRRFAARRGAVATNAGLQTALVIALLVGINVWSFRHYLRFDWTGRVFSPTVKKLDHFPYIDVSLLQLSGQFPQQFTLPANITDELRKLRAPTTIVVYQRHKTFAQLGEKPDAYDYAAERKVVEKVQDLVEQFREFGPQFRVEVLDVEAEDYDAKLDRLTRDAPALRAALDAAPDNSLFFHARREVGTRPDGKPDVRESVQRLSFTDFYQLDKTASLGKSVVVLLEKRRTTDQTGDAGNPAPNPPGAAAATDLARIEEKVRRLTDPDAKTGPDYRLIVLQAGAPDHTQKLTQVTTEAEPLLPLIDAADDNSVLVFKDGTPRAYGFREFSDLGDTEAREAIRPQGNLVLLPQGVKPFAQKVLALNERKPRIGIAVIHELLSSVGDDEEPYTMSGARKALTLQGFEVTDIVLKRWGGPELESVALTADLSRLEGIEEGLTWIESELDDRVKERTQIQATVDGFRAATLDELTQAFRSQLRGQRFTEAMRKRVVEDGAGKIEQIDTDIKQIAAARQQLDDEKLRLGASERVIEERRMTDLKAKMARLLAECDMLIVPRMTLRNLTSSPPNFIPGRLHRLSDVQANAIKEFMKAGKPVLACFGPINEPANLRMPGATGPDDLEEAFGQLGVQFGKQTVLYMSEGRAFAEHRSDVFGGGAKVDIPPAKFAAPLEKRARLFDPAALPGEGERLAPNPIAESMGLVARNLGSRQPPDLSLRHARPVYFVAVRPGGPVFAPEFLVSDEESWNEGQPFPVGTRPPRFEPPKADDPNKGTRDEKRRGPFPLAVAVETTVPADWTDSRPAAAKAASLTAAGATGDAATVAVDGAVPADAFATVDKDHPPTRLRVAAIGHGGLFAGPDLPPARERLLVTTCNWLLGRDERLPHPAGEWEYPRVRLSRRAEILWNLGTMLALPGLFAFLGVLVLTGRRYR